MCKYSSGNIKTGFVCKITKKRCAFQQYCTTNHAYTINKTEKCPAYKAQNDK